ncbi:hypothetical protein N0V90_004668 [Kalmusia sp. IMI 367209]|nr:hypothetical protein N0V90_004668 [Kalmusia sp. IMI 367209]
MDENQKEQRLPRSRQAEMANIRRSRLSEHNLRVHTAAYPKKPYFPIDHMRATQSRAEYDATRDHQRPDDALGFSYAGLSPQDMDMKARRKASLDALKLYSGNLASLSTPMDRLIARQCASPRRGEEALRETTAAAGDWETLDASELASELSGDSRPDEVMSVGSLRASSDTLSVSRERFLESEVQDRKEAVTRNWRRSRMRRRNTMDKTRGVKRAQKGAPPAQASRS